MFSLINEAHQLPSISRSSSDRSDSSTGCHPVSMVTNNQVKAEKKMYGANLYWEEENLETSLHGGSDPGLLDPPPWELDGKNTSNNLELELSVDLAKKLLLVNQSLGMESSQVFDNTFPPPGGSSTNSNPRYVKCSCPYVARNDPSLHLCRFKTEICRNFKEKGTCLYGELCQFAHGKHELRVSPASLQRFPWFTN